MASGDVVGDRLAAVAAATAAAVVGGVGDASAEPKDGALRSELSGLQMDLRELLSFAGGGGGGGE